MCLVIFLLDARSAVVVRRLVRNMRGRSPPAAIVAVVVSLLVASQRGRLSGGTFPVVPSRWTRRVSKRAF